MSLKNLSLAALAAFTFACSGGEEKSTATPSDAETAPAQEVVCDYSYTDADVEVLWVAYKYTEKTGVKGEFEQVEVTGGGTGPSPADALMGATINIATASSNSGDATRDPKIQESFFGGLTDGETLSGVITEATGDANGGMVRADLTMNGVTNSAEGTYEMDGETVELKFEINVGDWSAMDALNALNEVCEDLHKGADGQSILWPDVTVFVTTKLAKNCPEA